MEEKRHNVRFELHGADSTDPSLMRSDLPPATPALFEEYVKRFQHLRSSFASQDDLEIFLMLPLNDMEKFRLLAKLKSEGRQLMTDTDNGSKRERADVNDSPHKTLKVDSK